MADRLKVKFLTAIWGARYIKEFARVSLPSYLADGNIPFLASETDLEIVVLTSRASVPQFDEEAIFKKVRALCPLRFIFIDDLITSGNYGVTLTLAYARGIMDSGAEQTNTHFVFMNSDFVLADGAFRTLLAKLREGHGCVLAPSLRASAEATLPTLIDTVDQTSQTLTMPPRHMVKLAFDNLHPTVVGKTVTQNFITCDTHNQIYWQVDRTTLLARHYLIFMLAIKPEQPLRSVNSYCDYGFVPELVPSGRFTILSDSDDFFMLELQPALQESEFLRCGTLTSTEIARRLAGWTTREHRRFAEVDVIFHSEELPANFERNRREAAEYVGVLRKLMPNRPIDHVDHRYWKGGVQSWALRKFAGSPNSETFPPELCVDEDETLKPRQSRPSQPFWSRTRKKLTDNYIAFINRMRLAAGIIPHVPLWHHLWLDSQLIHDWVAHAKQQPHSLNLLICKALSPVGISLPRLATFEERIDPEAFPAYVAKLRSNSGDEGIKRFDNVFFHFRRAELHQAQQIIDLVGRHLKPHGKLVLHIWHEHSEIDHNNFAHELARYVGELLPTGWLGYQVEAKFAGGLMKRGLRKAERALFHHLIPDSLTRLPLFIGALGAWPIIAALTAANNLRMRNASTNKPSFCSSALISLTKKPESSAADVPAPSRRAVPVAD